jgi:hypothetical protein
LVALVTTFDMANKSLPLGSCMIYLNFMQAFFGVTTSDVKLPVFKQIFRRVSK